jgi:uncharacterized protein (DUF2236 family)
MVLTTLDQQMRTSIANAVRSRVAGPDADARRAALFDSPGPRWFAADRPVVTVHGDVSMFVGGLRALLLQSLHPLAMAGVADHSDYRHDPWGRLQRTADFLAATTFGPTSEAEQAVAMVRAVHRRVRGTAPDGRAYSADDPHLLRWVHLAEIDSFLVAHTRYGERPLDQEGRDGYVDDMSKVASALGVPAPPRSEQALRDQLRSFRGELHPTRAARDVARFLVVQPPVPLVVRPVYGVLAAAAVELLPGWARRALRLPRLPVAERLVVRPAATALTRAMRWALPPVAPAPPGTAPR